MAAILKIQKAKCTTLSEDLFLFQVSKGSAVRFPRNVPDKIDAEEKSGIIITRYDMIWRIIIWLPIPKTIKDINSQEQNILGNQILPKSEGFCILAAILSAIAKQTMDIISQHHNLLGNKCCPNRRIFVFWRPLWIQNDRHMVQHVLLPVNIHFHWNLLIF